MLDVGTFSQTSNMPATRERAVLSPTLALSGPLSVRYMTALAVLHAKGAPFDRTTSGPPASAAPAARNARDRSVAPNAEARPLMACSPPRRAHARVPRARRPRSDPRACSWQAPATAL